MGEEDVGYSSQCYILMRVFVILISEKNCL